MNAKSNNVRRWCRSRPLRLFIACVSLVVAFAALPAAIVLMAPPLSPGSGFAHIAASVMRWQDTMNAAAHGLAFAGLLLAANASWHLCKGRGGFWAVAQGALGFLLFIGATVIFFDAGPGL